MGNLSTAELHRLYPEGVISHSPLQCQRWDTFCERVLLPATFGGDDQLYPFWVHAATVEAWEAWRQVADHHGYKMTSTASGTVNCRKIGGSTRTSLHAAGIALDALPEPSAQMIRNLEAIRTTDGRQLFNVLTEINDGMHTQINVPREAIVIDWSTVAGTTPGGDDMFRRGDQGPDVEQLQEGLIYAGYPLPEHGADGDYGQETADAVAALKAEEEYDGDGDTLRDAWAARLFDLAVPAPPVNGGGAHTHPDYEPDRHTHPQQGRTGPGRPRQEETD